MRILLSNDDGINAHGLKVLESIARQFSDDIWIVAPETEQSGAGHSLTLHRPLRVREISEKKFAVSGTPTDCVMMAVNHLMRQSPPDIVFSGVNHGGNLAEDITYSGTVAAAMEATLCGFKAIAFSLVVDYGHPAKWHTVEHHAPEILEKLIHMDFPENTFVNVNFPDLVATSVKGMAVTHQGRRPGDEKFVERVDPRGNRYFWIDGIDYKQGGPEGTDLNAISQGYISITPLSLDFTHEASLEKLNRMFA